MKNLINFDKKIANKFPFIFLFFCYWINTYSTLGSKIILHTSSEDNIFENLSAILIFLSALYILRTIFFKTKAVFSSRNFTLIFLFIFLLIWAFEEISWGQRIFNFTWDEISNINYQNEINLHNLNSFQPHLHKSYYIVGLILSFFCVLKKKTKSSLLPDKSILYFFLLPSLYYLIGELIFHFPIKIQGEIVIVNQIFHFQEVNEFLLALGAFLYSLRVFKNKKI